MALGNKARKRLGRQHNLRANGSWPLFYGDTDIWTAVISLCGDIIIIISVWNVKGKVGQNQKKTLSTDVSGIRRDRPAASGLMEIALNRQRRKLTATLRVSASANGAKGASLRHRAGRYENFDYY